MNAIYRLVWSVARNGWVVASELARSRRKSGRTTRRGARRMAVCHSEKHFREKLVHAKAN